MRSFLFLLFGGPGGKELGLPQYDSFVVGDRIRTFMCSKAGKWARCPSGQQQAAAIALRAACSGIVNTRHTHSQTQLFSAETTRNTLLPGLWWPCRTVSCSVASTGLFKSVLFFIAPEHALVP